MISIQFENRNMNSRFKINILVENWNNIYYNIFYKITKERGKYVKKEK